LIVTRKRRDGCEGMNKFSDYYATRMVFNVQIVLHSPNTLPTIAYGQTFRIITRQSLLTSGEENSVGWALGVNVTSTHSTNEYRL